jgi:hypothetical protein
MPGLANLLETWRLAKFPYVKNSFMPAPEHAPALAAVAASAKWRIQE